MHVLRPILEKGFEKNLMMSLPADVNTIFVQAIYCCVIMASLEKIKLQSNVLRTHNVFFPNFVAHRPEHITSNKSPLKN